MIDVGITEYHGIAQEYTKYPPKGIRYSPVESSGRYTKYIFQSHAKGVYNYVNSKKHDIIEAPIFPVITKQPLVYTPALFASAGTFNFFGIPTPRIIKMLFVREYLKRSNVKAILFKSNYGLETIKTYGGISDPEILSKCNVVHPAIRRVDDSLINFEKRGVIKILFVGEFIGKGGANVVDAFERINREYPETKLVLCSNDNFQTTNKTLKDEYLRKINRNKNIEMNYYPRDILMEEVYPDADIYVCPTYREAWGFSIQEAMAFGRPIITSNVCAIPEMIEDGFSGITLDIKDTDYIKNYRGFLVNEIPSDFKENLTHDLYLALRRLIEDYELRRELGENALAISREKFSIETRNTVMKEIYLAALE